MAQCKHLEETNMAQHTVVVMEGDQTGQELLAESLRVLDPAVTKVDVELAHFDLSLENRRTTQNAVVHEAAQAMKHHGLGLKAATITPETKGDVGSPNAILRSEIDGTVIVRTGRRLPVSCPLAAFPRPCRSCGWQSAMLTGPKNGAKGKAMTRSRIVPKP